MESHQTPLDDLYREVVLDHCKSPRGRGPIDSPDVENEGLNPVCGDEVKIAVKFSGDRVEDVQVLNRGCSISTASGSMMAELLPGKTLEEAERLATAFKDMMHDRSTPEDIEIGDLDALEGVKKFPVRIKCALLSWVTLLDILHAWREGAKPTAPSTTEPDEEE